MAPHTPLIPRVSQAPPFFSKPELLIFFFFLFAYLTYESFGDTGFQTPAAWDTLRFSFVFICIFVYTCLKVLVEDTVPKFENKIENLKYK